MSELAEKIKKAASVRLRPGSVEINGESFFLSFRVYPAAELSKMIAKLQRSSEKAAAELLAEQIVNPADGKPVFTGKELLELPNPDYLKLAAAFLSVNNGGSEKN